MPQRLRRLMTDLIERGICPVTLATATLTEGVNLPFDIVFLTSLERRSYDAQAGQPIVVPMSTAEFRNLAGRAGRPGAAERSEEHTSELQSLMRISYAVFCLKKKKQQHAKER